MISRSPFAAIASSISRSHFRSRSFSLRMARSKSASHWSSVQWSSSGLALRSASFGDPSLPFAGGACGDSSRSPAHLSFGDPPSTGTASTTSSRMGTSPFPFPFSEGGKDWPFYLNFGWPLGVQVLLRFVQVDVDIQGVQVPGRRVHVPAAVTT
jgi:hypothetical protein